LQLLNTRGHRLHASHDVADQALAGPRRHQAEEVTGLRVVIAVKSVIVAIYGARDGPGTLTVGGIFGGAIEAIGLVVHLRAGVSIEAHETVPVIRMHRALRLVDRQRVVVHAEAITV